MLGKALDRRPKLTPHDLQVACAGARIVPRSIAVILAIVQVASAGCERRAESSSPVLPAGTIEQEVRIGSLDDPTYALTEITDLEVAPDGSIFSLHGQEALIRRWSPAGEALGTIGKRGEGPGEFLSPREIGWQADSLWVFDSGNVRISFFDASGNYLGALSPSLTPPTAAQAAKLVFPPVPAGLLGDGSIHGATMATAAAIVQGKVNRIAHVRMSPDGATLDTVVTTPVGRESVFHIGTGWGGMVSPQPFSDGVLCTLTHDGKAFLIVERQASRGSTDSAFQLHRVELNGDTAYTKSFRYPPVRIPPDTLESYINSKAASMQAFSDRGSVAIPSRVIESVREAMYTPEFYPPVGELVAGRDGTIWLALEPRKVSTAEWLVLDAAGEAIGTVELPRGMTLMAAERAMGWGTERDEFDVEYIVRYRIRFPNSTE